MKRKDFCNLGMEIVVMVVFVLLIVVYFWQIFNGDLTLIKPVDSMEVIYQPSYFIAKCFKNFDLPLWNPHNFAGFSVVGNPTWGLFYPVNIFFWLFPYADGLYPYYAYDNLILFHVFLSGWFMYLLGRGLKFNRLVAFSMGVMYMFSPSILSYMGWVHAFSVTALLPLVFLFVYLSFKKRSNFIYPVFAGLFLAFSVLASPSGRFLFTFLIIGFYYLFLLIRNWHNRKYLKAITISCFVIFGLGFLISSVSTLPIIEFLPYSKRFLGGVGAISGNESVPMEFFNLVRVHFKDLIGIILPSYSNIGIGVIYFGVTPVLLTFYAIYKFWRRNHLVLFLSLLMIFALVYSLGIVIPYIFHEIPFVNRIRQPQKYLTVIAFVIPILAGFGLNSIFNFINEEKK